LDTKFSFAEGNYFWLLHKTLVKQSPRYFKEFMISLEKLNVIIYIP